jgi:DNA-binding PadR family transcriptional regulator
MSTASRSGDERYPAAVAAPSSPAPGAVPITGYALLGLLSFGRELSGYELKKWADHSLSRFFLSPSMSQIYAELPRLEARALVTARDERTGDRTTRLYRITDAGTDELRRWLRDSPVDDPVLKHPALLRVWLGHLLDPDQLRTIVTEHLQRTEALLASVRHDLEVDLSDAGFGYSQAIVRWAERQYENEIANTTELLAELDRTGRRG